MDIGERICIGERDNGGGGRGGCGNKFNGGPIITNVEEKHQGWRNDRPNHWRHLGLCRLSDSVPNLPDGLIAENDVRFSR